MPRHGINNAIEASCESAKGLSTMPLGFMLIVAICLYGFSLFRRMLMQYQMGDNCAFFFWWSNRFWSKFEFFCSVWRFFLEIIFCIWIVFEMSFNQIWNVFESYSNRNFYSRRALVLYTVHFTNNLNVT